MIIRNTCRIACKPALRCIFLIALEPGEEGVFNVFGVVDSAAPESAIGLERNKKEIIREMNPPVVVEEEILKTLEVIIN
jgi:hypothetical protein